MSTHDDGRNAENTADWPSEPVPPPPPAPEDDDGGATTVVPRMPPPPPPAPPPWPGPPPPPQHPWSGAPYPGPGMPPPPPPPPGWGPPGGPPPYPLAVSPKPRKSGGRKWALIGAAVVAVIALVAAGVFLFRGSFSGESGTAATTSAAPSPAPSTTTTTPTVPPTVAPAAAATHLAAVDEVNRLADNVPLTPGPVSREPITGTFVDPFYCAGAVAPGLQGDYSNSGFTGFAAQNLSAESPNYRIVQVVAVFATADDAQDFFDEEMKAWGRCTNQDVTLTIIGAPEPQPATTRTVDIKDGVAILPILPAPDRTCERALTQRNNVIVDVRFCGPTDNGGGYNLARAIADKIPAGG